MRQADVVTVNLGTNDYSIGKAPAAATFLRYYGGLLRMIRQEAPPRDWARTLFLGPKKYLPS